MRYVSGHHVWWAGLAMAAYGSSVLAGSGGFAVSESSVSGLGNAYAGTASGADASTIYSNPAGMSRLPGNQFVVMGSVVRPSASFTSTMTAADYAPLQAPGGNGNNPGSMNYIPAMFLSSELSPGLHAGFGVNVPFGLQTDYGNTWAGRFQATKSSISTINLNPALSWQATEAVSLAAGLNYQSIRGELSNMVNYSAAGAAAGAAVGAAAAVAGGAPVGSAPYLAAVAAGQAAGLAAAGGPNSAGLSTMSGSDNAWGYNLGMTIEASPQTRFGLAYRSAINYTLHGTVSFTNVPPGLAAALVTAPVTLALKVPDTWSVSVFHRMSDQWDLMADVTRTGWSSVQNLTVRGGNGAVLSNTQEGWRDTFRFALGANYHYDADVTARIGVAYDQSPVPDVFRTARLPDQNRTWLALGAQYKLSPATVVDIAYAHLFMANAPIASNQTASGAANLVGSYTSLQSNILGLQLGHNF